MHADSKQGGITASVGMAKVIQGVTMLHGKFEAVAVWKVEKRFRFNYTIKLQYHGECTATIIQHRSPWSNPQIARDKQKKIQDTVVTRCMIHEHTRWWGVRVGPRQHFAISPCNQLRACTLYWATPFSGNRAHSSHRFLPHNISPSWSQFFHLIGDNSFVICA